MDIGVISVRYARALLACATERGEEQAVYSEMRTLAKSYIEVPQLRSAIENPMHTAADKEKLLESAAGGTPSELTQAFLRLVLREGRESMTQFIANSYITLYKAQKNIISGCLTTAVPVADKTKLQMQRMVEARAGAAVEFETEVNPDILGGFILEYDTYRMDASLKTKLGAILNKLRA